MVLVTVRVCPAGTTIRPRSRIGPFLRGNGGDGIAVDVGGIGIGFVEIAVDAEAQYVLDNRAAEVEADTVGCPFLAVLRLVGVIVHRSLEFFRHFFGNDIDHAAHRAGTVAGGGGGLAGR